MDASALDGMTVRVATNVASTSPKNAAIALRTQKLCFAVEWGTLLRSVPHCVELSGRS